MEGSSQSASEVFEASIDPVAGNRLGPTEKGSDFRVVEPSQVRADRARLLPRKFFERLCQQSSPFRRKEACETDGFLWNVSVRRFDRPIGGLLAHQGECGRQCHFIEIRGGMFDFFPALETFPEGRIDLLLDVRNERLEAPGADAPDRRRHDSRVPVDERFKQLLPRDHGRMPLRWVAPISYVGRAGGEF
jgi:hypothetical protein